MLKSFYIGLIISFSLFESAGALSRSDEMHVEGPDLSPTRAAPLSHMEQIKIVGNASSAGRVILNSWEVYRSHCPLNLDPDLEALALDHLMSLFGPNGSIINGAIKHIILKDKNLSDKLSGIFYSNLGNKVEFISDANKYRQFLEENILKNAQGSLRLKEPEQWDPDNSCMFTISYVKGGYTQTRRYIHCLSEFMIDYALIDFTVNYFEIHGGHYRGEVLKQTLNRFASLFAVIENKSLVYGENGYNPLGFGNFVAGYTKARYIMQCDGLNIEGNIAFLGNGVCDLHRCFANGGTTKIILNDLDAVFPLLSLHKARLSGDVLNQYDVVGMSAVEMKYEDNSLSKIYAGYLLKYLSDQDLTKMFQDISRALKVGGRFYIDELSDLALIEMGKQAKEKSNSPQSFEHLMKCQPLMNKVISLAHRSNLKCVYAFSNDWDQEDSPFFQRFAQDKVPVKNEKTSNSLVFERINFGPM